MKILYAVQGTGNGHLSRAIALLPEWMKYGKVDVLISGTQSQITFPYPVKYRFRGMSFIPSKRGGINLLKTMLITRPFTFLKEIKALPVEEFDLVISDFEPVSAWACKRKGIPCIEMSHQAAVRDATSPQTKRRFPVGRWIIKKYCPSTSSIGFHFEAYSENIFQPILRKEIIESAPVQGDHYVVYLTGYGDDIIARVLNSVEATFIIFSKELKQQVQIGNCCFKPISNEVFLEDLLSAHGVICGAGFELPAEALYLKKKLLVIPYANHYEQHCNAASLERLGAMVLFSLCSKDLASIQNWCDSSHEVTYQWEDPLSLAVHRAVQLSRTIKP
jgi:uncharacterized protein (TIGR00661 family)